MSVLSQLLARLSGVGVKSAERLAKSIGDQQDDFKSALARAIIAQGAPVPCPCCGDDGGPEKCARCLDGGTEASRILVVRSPKDRARVEGTGVWRGAYHVLRGVLDSSSGVGPAQLKIRSLLDRLRDGAEPRVTEVVLALGGSDRGRDTTAFVGGLMPPGVDVWTIGIGVSSGMLLEYATDEDIAVAMGDRRRML